MDTIKLQCIVDQVDLAKKKVTLLISNKIELQLEDSKIEEFSVGNIVTVSINTSK